MEAEIGRLWLKGRIKEETKSPGTDSPAGAQRRVVLLDLGTSENLLVCFMSLFFGPEACRI